MNRELIVNATTDGVEIALLEDKNLVELHHDKLDNNFAVGDIFLAKVKKIVPGLNASFVDVGHDKDAFLHYTDLGPKLASMKKYVRQITDGQRQTHLLEKFEIEPEIIKTGKMEEVMEKRDHVLVQILKEPISTKGPRLSCEITLAGRYVVLVPFSNKISVSRKVKDKEERQRLEQLCESIKPKNFGLIVRTAAEERSVADIHEDINNQLERWKNILTALQKKQSPPAKVLVELNKTSGILRDLLNDEFHSITVNDKAMANNLKNYISEVSSSGQERIVHYYNNKTNIFDYFKVSKQIKMAFGKTVGMKSGAYLVIEHTEAMHVIDVNSGHKMSSAQNQETNSITVNLEAAEEIARQLRLRDLGGLIVIDFIDMKDAENRKMLHRRMKESMQNDRARHTILPLSKFGLIQITRQRARPELKINTAEICPTCKGSGKVKSTILLVDEIESNLGYLLTELDLKNLTLVVHPYVEAFIKKGMYSKQRQWFVQFKKWIEVESDEDCYLTAYKLYDAKTGEIKMQ